MQNTTSAAQVVRNFHRAAPANEVSPESGLRRELVALRPHLHQVAMSLTRDDTLADDLVQDAMEKALSQRGQFQKGSNLRAWAKTVMRNAFFDRHRHERLHVPLQFDVAWHDHRPCWSPVEQLTVDDVVTALRSLRPIDRQVVELALLEERSYREISQRLGVVTNTVASRLARARGRLRTVLEAAYEQRCIAPRICGRPPGETQEEAR